MARSLLGVALLAGIRIASAQSAPAVRPLSYMRFELPNGLVALLNEDHTSPVVGVEVLVHVGAKDEHTGHTGLAHLCEHLMGEGSPNLPQQQKAFILALGGSSPGFLASWGATDEDRTHYFYTIPSNELETALWMEGDRFAAPMSKADEEHVKTVREIIRQERLQNRDNQPQPYADGGRIITDAFYIGRDQHPRDPLGPMTDLDAATAADARRFCGPYYVPNNVVLSISGDFNTANAETLIRKYFGSIPRGAAPVHPDVSPVPFATEKRLVLEDARRQTPMMRFAWFGAGVSQPDREPLNALATVIGQGADRTGKLSKLLVYDRELATSVAANNFDMETAGIFQIEIVPRSGASLSAIETLVDSVLTDLRATPVDEHALTPFKRSSPVQAVTTLQTRAARADTLAQSEAYAHDPTIYVRQAVHIERLTPVEIQDVARRYLTTQRIVMSIVPAGKLDLIAKPELPYTNVTPTPPARER